MYSTGTHALCWYGFYLRITWRWRTPLWRAAIYMAKVTHSEPCSSIHGSAPCQCHCTKSFGGPDLIRHTKTTFSGLLADDGQSHVARLHCDYNACGTWCCYADLNILFLEKLWLYDIFRNYNSRYTQCICSWFSACNHTYANVWCKADCTKCSKCCVITLIIYAQIGYLIFSNIRSLIIGVRDN